MKHSVKITLILISIFVLAQVFGLITINNYIHPVRNETTGETTIEYPSTAMGEVPVLTEEEKSLFPIQLMISILIGTSLVFILRRFKVKNFFRYWFLLVIFMTLLVAFDVYIDWRIAITMAAVLAYWRVFRPNIYVHNITEMFIYTGVVIILIGFLNITAAFLLLLLISIYDMIAVWKSHHMIKLAKFMIESKVFAGLSVPYKRPPEKPKKAGTKLKEVKVTTAILGGGDIAFPLLFSASAMQHFIITYQISKITSLLYALIITVFVTISLTLLFFKGQKDKFYPAMPFLSLGCIAGYGIVYVLFLI